MRSGSLSSQLRMARDKEGNPIEIIEKTVERQCDPEYVELVRRHRLGRGSRTLHGLRSRCSVYGRKIRKYSIYPALNTTFVGGSKKEGYYVERCQTCGECKLYFTGGICPIARCSKSLLNGPCGGSTKGKCEIDPEVDCAWQLILDRLKSLGPDGSLHRYYANQ